MDINLTQQGTRRKVVKLFLLIFVNCALIVTAIAVLFYHQEQDRHIAEIMTNETHAVELQSLAVGDEFNTIVSDMLFLSRQNELLNYLDDADINPTNDIEAEYLQMASTKRAYDQIRFLDNTGMERVRINYSAGTAKAVAKDSLQNKSNRYYFEDSINLDQQEVFVSPLDLNIEHKQVEVPFKPMIRFGTPVHDRQGAKRGVILLNYLGDKLRTRITNSGGFPEAGEMLLNSNGYWLLSPNAEDEWGFMFPDKAGITFPNAYPAEWEAIAEDGENGAGQVLTDNGLFTFKTIFPVKIGEDASTGNVAQGNSVVVGDCSQGLFWILVSHVTPEVLHQHSHGLKGKLLLNNIIILVLLAIGVWHLAQAITKRNIYQSNLIALAMYDTLTGLPNRKLFFDQLEKGLELAERNKRLLGLLYIDLDGFKQVNDTLGHEAGDELLVQVGIRMKNCVRKSDTVARLGGDEFAVVLPEINANTGSMTTGSKIIDSLESPFELKSGSVTIGASIGAAVFPHHGTTAETLIKKADQAMYRAKANGKNTCIMVDDTSETA